jgi:hypothetical protein
MRLYYKTAINFRTSDCFPQGNHNENQIHISGNHNENQIRISIKLKVGQPKLQTSMVLPNGFQLFQHLIKFFETILNLL